MRSRPPTVGVDSPAALLTFALSPLNPTQERKPFCAMRIPIDSESEVTILWEVTALQEPGSGKLAYGAVLKEGVALGDCAGSVGMVAEGEGVDEGVDEGVRGVGQVNHFEKRSASLPTKMNECPPVGESVFTGIFSAVNFLLQRVNSP